MFQFQLLLFFVIIFIIIIGETLLQSSASYCYPRESSCPSWLPIHEPFWIRDVNNYNCAGYPGFEVKCAENGRPVINISNNLYHVLNIEFRLRRITIIDVVMDGQDCPQPRRNFSMESTSFLDYYYYDDYDYDDYNNYNSYGSKLIIFYNCTNSLRNGVQQQRLPCLQNYNNNTHQRSSYAFLENQIPSGFNLYDNCEENVVVPVSISHEVPTDANFTQILKKGFSLSWSYPSDCQDCEISGGHCWTNKTTSVYYCKCPDDITYVDNTCGDDKNISAALKIIFGVIAAVGGIFLLIVLLIHRWKLFSLYFLINWRNKNKSPTNVEIFLKGSGCLPLQRYKYSDVKKMTNSFKDRLGQGGYGNVFKGKLHNGRLVAVKVLNESKGKGDDFINEVATIGRTNHVNVVSLVGFCTEGTKRALVYEFMPNGSLERFIYNEKNSDTATPLGWEKLYQIALGIARGLEYLHRGCNTRILHFDIKPHNILLDHDFCPKISDFGLAKLCPTRESVVSLVGARGTIGYIAPEVYCRNFGGVSHKSDVYSYGMMVLEMIGGRKNIDATVENISEIYFPQWIYNRIKRDIKLEGLEDNKIEGSREIFEDQTVKKMIIISLWCIQAHPRDRPSMSKVVDMLEGNVDELQMSPNPFPDPSSIPSSSSS